MSCCMSTLGLLRMTEPAVFGYNMSYVHEWSSNCCTTFACLHCTHNTTQPNPTQHNTTQPNPTQHNTTQHNTTQHKIFGFLCCHPVDKGGGVLFRSVLGLC